MAETNAKPVRMLLVSREPSVTDRLQDVGRRNDWEIEVASGGMEALERVQSGVTQLILLDLVPGDSESLHTLRWLQRVRPDVPIIMLSPPDNTAQVLDGVRLGAQDYVLKPCKEGQMEKVIRRHLNGSGAGSSTEPSAEHIEAIGDDLFFVAVGSAMQKVRARAELLSQVNAPVLIIGEPGSGKDVTARLVHKLSVRSGFRFVKVSCSALSGDFLENELFGYDRAASSQDKPCKLELAHRGTILLEEIAEMPTSLQSKLLRVLQDKQFVRASDDSVIDIDVRVIATTSTGIERSLADKKLREDLYYRLSAFTIQVPPLRQRKEEIPLLIGHLMSRMAKHYGLPPRTISTATLEKCQRYSWPGNLAELENFVKRYLVTGDDAAVAHDVEPGMFEEKVERPNDGEPAISGSLKSLVRSAKGDTERNAIATALEKTHWNRKAASRMLRISYRALLYKIQEYHISPPGAYLSPASLGQGAKGHGE
jgi:two-component system, NtrC family, response regulator AtoC